MIGALVALLSLDMTRKLVAAGTVATTLTIVGATNATPIVLETSAKHLLTKPTHAVIANVSGNTAANGTWVMTPTDPTHLSLSTYDAAGQVVDSVGTGTYTSGGSAYIAFPDGSILLGRRNVDVAMAMATPRIVLVPIGSSAWELSPYGGRPNAIPSLPNTQANMNAEQAYMMQHRQLCTERSKFEVHVYACGDPPDPDFGDFDATQTLYHSFYESMFNMITPDRVRVLGGTWESQAPSDVGLLDVHGQKWVGIIEIQQPVMADELAFAPSGVTGTIIVNFEGGSSTDQTVIVVTP